MEVALRQRLDGVAAVSISEGEQTTEVIFAPGDHAFSIEAFRLALRQADVAIVSVEIDACGIVERGEETRLEGGKTDLLLKGADDAPSGSPVCISGRLEQPTDPLRVQVDRWEPAPELVLTR
jgi:hypothetical protein